MSFLPSSVVTYEFPFYVNMGKSVGAHGVSGSFGRTHSLLCLFPYGAPSLPFLIFVSSLGICERLRFNRLRLTLSSNVTDHETATHLATTQTRD